MAQVYSRKLWSIKNFAGDETLVNPGPNIYIIRTVTLWYGALQLNFFSLGDENHTVMLQNSSVAAEYDFQIWNELRLVWPAGLPIHIHSDFSMDCTGHGYELTVP